ncbi:MAG TPA: DUF1700 domain-containing protein [Firmicutes bacterium]|nr:DUF1700 domain-containing protein [Bacillota bacterium]
MNKEQFLAAVKVKIAGLPQSDIEKSLGYYEEMIDDHMEDGLTEEQSVEMMGTVDEVATQILMDTPLSKLVKVKVQPSRAWRVWEILLLILGSPIWLSLLLAALVLLVSVYIVIWSVVIALYAVNVSVAAAGIAGIAGSIILTCTGNYIQALLFLGGGLFCAGIAILLFFAFNQVAAGILKLSRWIILWVKSWFIGKGRTK